MEVIVMKKLRKFTFSFLSVIMLVGGVAMTPVWANEVLPESYTNHTEFDSFSEEIIAEFGYEFYNNHSYSVDLINEFYQLLPLNRLGQAIYPSDFGGMYINEDGNLVVLQVFGPFLSIENQFSENIIVESANFSYNEILATNNILIYFFMNHYTLPSIGNIASFWTDVVNNRIVVYLHNYSAEKTDALINDTINSPLIEFYQHVPSDEQPLPLAVAEDDEPDFTAEPPVSFFGGISPFNTITIRPGDGIRVGSPTAGRCSVGFRATSGNRQGFVTAAHCGDANNVRVYTASGVHIGTFRNRTLTPIDAAFVEINANVTVTNQISNQINLVATAATPVVGQLISSIGVVSGLRSGLIERINVTEDVAGIGRLVNTTIASMPSIHGDSGGVAFSETTGVRSYNIQGIAITRIGDTRSRISRTSQILDWTAWRLN